MPHLDREGLETFLARSREEFESVNLLDELVERCCPHLQSEDLPFIPTCYGRVLSMLMHLETEENSRRATTVDSHRHEDAIFGVRRAHGAAGDRMYARIRAIVDSIDQLTAQIVLSLLDSAAFGSKQWGGCFAAGTFQIHYISERPA